MNYIKHLTGFFDKVATDTVLNPTHVSLYIAIFQFWNISRFRNPISISREELMRISKISSLATYHKCMKNLDAHGYIKYEPSFNPYKGSQVYVFDFGESRKQSLKKSAVTTLKNEPPFEQVVNNYCTSSHTTNEQALVRYINNTKPSNKIKDKNDIEIVSENLKRNDAFCVPCQVQEKKGSDKRKEIPAIPNLEEVLQYFQTNKVAVIEARKFFSYYESKGWLVGNSVMHNWRAAVEHWILNMTKFNPSTSTLEPGVLRASVLKNYNEPL